jgi:hypothetical protein
MFSHLYRYVNSGTRGICDGMISRWCRMAAEIPKLLDMIVFSLQLSRYEIDKQINSIVHESICFNAITISRTIKIITQNIYFTLYAQRTNIQFVQQFSIPLYHNYAGQCLLTLGHVIYTKFQEFGLLVYTYMRCTWRFYM